MYLQIRHKIISPVNIEERRNLDLRSGDTVRVWQKIQEKGKTRRQAFEGLVLARKHGKEAGGTFTVRRVSSGVGMEKIFPLYSPMIDKIEILKRAKVRRSKLYYIREKAAKEIRRQMRRSRFMDLSTESDIEARSSSADEAQTEDADSKQTDADTGEMQINPSTTLGASADVNGEESGEGGEEVIQKEKVDETEKETKKPLDTTSADAKALADRQDDSDESPTESEEKKEK